jgi:hypothetical protein
MGLRGTSKYDKLSPRFVFKPVSNEYAEIGDEKNIVARGCFVFVCILIKNNPNATKKLM